MRTALPFAIVFTLLPALASGQQEKVQDSLPAAPAGMTWKQIWNDDFDGTVLDENKWTYRPDAKRKDGWWDRKAVTLDGKGNLVIKTYKDGDKNIDGCITTQGKFEHAFGYYVARVRFQKQPGHWSAFWMMCNGVGKVGDEGRDGTEIDIMEKPWLDERVQHTFHWDGYGKAHKSEGKVVKVPDVMNGFHTFGLWWTPTEYVFYIDGKETWRTKAGGVSQVPEYMLLSDEIGKWGGDIAKAELPDEFVVDYVRVYDLACVTSALAADQTLFDFGHATDFAGFQKSDTTITAVKAGTGMAMRMTTGTSQPWPGVTLPAPDGHWDMSPFAQVAVRVKNVGSTRGTLICRVDNPGADGTKNCVNGTLTLNPGQSGTLQVALRRSSDDTLGSKLFGMRGYPVAVGGLGTINPANINQILLFVNRPKEACAFEVEGLSATGTHTAPTAWTADAAPFFPFIDTFGQYKHKDWLGKIHSLTELQERRDSEAKELAAQPGPKDWDKYGGCATGPQLRASGFFRAEKSQGKWWLVDPDGHLFFSHGIDCVRMIDNTPIDERADWFQDFPGIQPEFKEFLGSGSSLKGHYAGRSPQCFTFAGANLKRKYGPEWKPAYTTTIHQRLRSWGLNTIANWSDPEVYLQHHTPYTDTLGTHGVRMIEGSEGYWGKFPDVFDPGFSDKVRRAMQDKRATTANDPWCIGYFSDNEMSWGDDTSLALGALKSPPDQAAKIAFIADLKAKYGDIGKLNTAWGSQYGSWDALLTHRAAPDPRKARADLTAFYSKSAETYFRTVRDAIKSVAPNQLYLGCRFAWVNDLADRAAGKYCDVISYNLYQRSVADFKNPSSDKPLIIGEFHFGALDRGLFHTGLVPVENQTARAMAYTDYVLGAMKHPQLVGTHWFQWMDEPTTGRVYDEENYQIGFLDVADTPYPEIIAASRKVGNELYRRR